MKMEVPYCMSMMVWGTLLSMENSNEDMVTFTYDRNGNQTGWDNTQNSNNRFITWDEENRIETVSDNGHTSYYVYAPQGHFLASSRHASGERTLKRSSQGETFYVNAYFVIREEQVASKHFFAGSQRIATKLTKQESQTITEPDLGTVTQEEIDQAELRVAQAQTRVDETQAAYDAAKGSDKKPAKDALDEAKDALQTAQDALATLLETQAQTQTSTEKTANAKPVNIIYEKQQYYYHPDHLGSSSFVTDAKGKVYEHLEYFPFGETWAHEHSNTQRTPYRFTGKEYDETTGLYYYGARYYDPRTSVWQSVDPILGEYMSGQTNGGVFNPQNLGLYTYTANNPINLVDPNGESLKLVKSAYNVLKKTYKNGGDFKKASKDELAGIYENVAELVDGDLSMDDFYAAVDLVTGFGKEAKKATRLLKREEKRKLGIPNSRATIGKKRDPKIITQGFKGKGQQNKSKNQEFYEDSNGKTVIISRHPRDRKHKGAHIHLGTPIKDGNGYKELSNSVKYDNIVPSVNIK